MHVALEEWKRYARDELDEDKRDMYEEHLYACDQCMGLYMEAMEDVEDDLPSIEGPSLYTDEVMERIPFERAAVGKQSRRHWYEEKMFHYVMAVAMTLILMATGIFGELVKVTAQFEHNPKATSFTQSIMDKTSSLLDEIEDIEEQEAK
ncbi:hypothetical protein [Bacillus sp. KH172YL63]|uniref:hypothetical protein n=1 Tax=Bacillus sp. KH172YL63 TaxID=2709784 RepID=UPI0013E44BC9|nr:hypothetical protein [Bacillus sp. KH172YL63]BCB02649.1 hypothetical protein KH172YL63_07820 [Bacillus sp. KH172YL63]